MKNKIISGLWAILKMIGNRNGTLESDTQKGVFMVSIGNDIADVSIKLVKKS